MIFSDEDSGEMMMGLLGLRVLFAVSALLCCISAAFADEEGIIEPPALSQHQVDLLFDSLRSSSDLKFPPLHTSQSVDPNIVGIWAGSRSIIESSVGPVVLRFRRRVEELVAAAKSGSSLGSETLESFDLTIKTDPYLVSLAHSHPENAYDAKGLKIPYRGPERQTVAPFIPGFRNSGMYVAVLATQEDQDNWGVFVCPRTVGRDPKRGLVFKPSMYELSEVKVEIKARADIEMSTAGAEGLVRVFLARSKDLPPTAIVKDEVKSTRPWIQLEYRPKGPFDFFRFKPHSDVQESLQFAVRMENKVGYIRDQFFSRTIYFHKTDEPMGVPVFYGRTRPAADNGECYIVAYHGYSWAEYGRKTIEDPLNKTAK